MQNKADKSTFFIRNNILYKSCPSCSKNNDKEIYYPCPSSFGYRHHNAYSQSSCTKCRGLKGKPSRLFDGFVTRENDELINEIRILPMGKNEFPTVKDCKQFLIEEMPSRGNVFHYRTHNMITDTNSLILFQYSGNIIAYGFFDSEGTFNENDEICIKGYKGFYKFKENSVKFLNKFINNEEMKKVFGISLGQGTQHISINYLPKFLELFDFENENDEFEILDISSKNLIERKYFDITGAHDGQVRENRVTEKDYVQAYKNQTKVGHAGEMLVFNYEKEKLLKFGRRDLADKVKLVSADASLGYDILSFDKDGDEIHIEVKSKSSKLTYFDFYISNNEFNKFKDDDKHFVYYISNLKSNSPDLFVLNNKMITESHLHPVLYKVLLDYIVKEDL